MNRIFLVVTVSISSLLLFFCTQENKKEISNIYPKQSERILSANNVTYYIDPNHGNDKNKGTNRENPWKTFRNINQLIFTKGNKIEIIASGTFRESLFLIGHGTSKHPVTVQFAPGKYDFYPENAFKSKFHISNTNDAPDSLKAVAMYFLNSENINIEGQAAEIVFRGKVIETCINNCNNININDLTFDYFRPTMSEIQVVDLQKDYADVQIHPDSKYNIKDSNLTWVGEGWQHPVQNYWQEYSPSTQIVKRKGLAVDKMKFSEISNNNVRIHFNDNPGFVKGMIYQNRNIFRDYAAFFIQKSKNISWSNINVYFLHGLGFVNQFCENITFDSLIVRPRENSGRTCAAWADILHFSSCKGDINISNSYLSATNDDPINVHGTHLRIIDTMSNRSIKIAYMHPQTYGFDPFILGDSIEFINHKSLMPYAKNIVLKVEQLNDKEYILHLADNLPNNITIKDVIENSTWTPNVFIRNSSIIETPTRGILVSTKGKVLIENNIFKNSVMSAILVADDANSWFESGYVRDMTIKNNQFIACASPIINIHPENSEINDSVCVHQNISILNNIFESDDKLILSAKSVNGLMFNDNQIKAKKDLKIDDFVKIQSCISTTLINNKIETNE